MTRRGRVLVAKLGLDGHDRGARLVGHILRDAGYEVIYTGLRRTPELVVNVAVEEDVDLIGVSVLSGAHEDIVKELLTVRDEKGLNDVPIVVGGIIPEHDVQTLLDLGVAAVLGPGASTGQIVETVDEVLERGKNEALT